METVEFLIAGGGTAGLAAAAALAERGRSVLLAEREDGLGGILRQCLHRGFGRERTGPEYAAGLVSRLAGTGVQVRLGTQVLALSPDKTALLSSRKGLERVRFARCVLAAGCRERTLQSLPVAGTRPAGIFTAGTVQRLMNRRGWDVGDHILVLGTGDVGQIVARQLVQAGKSVSMLEQRDRPGGLARNRRDCLEAFHIPVLLRSTVDEVLGQGRISGVLVRNLDTGRRREMPCDTLVTALGLVPDRALCRGLGEPDWLALLGNCAYVHDRVEGIIQEAGALGAAWGEQL